MDYKGPKIFEERINIAYRKALGNSFPADYHPSPDFEISMGLGGELGSGYTSEELSQGRIRVNSIKLEEWDQLNPYYLLGFNSKAEYFQKIDSFLKNFQEENIVETSRQLRELCGLKALRKLADTYEPLWKQQFPNETITPFAYSRDPLFVELSFGIDFSINSPNFQNVGRKGISFPPSTLVEAFYPGILVGYDIPSSIKTSTDYYRFVGNLMADVGVKLKIYQQNSPFLLAHLIAHGLIHYKLTTESPPYYETGKLSFPKRSIVLSEELVQKIKNLEDITRRSKELDCDILIESAARAIAPTALCRSLERERYHRLELADKVLAANPSLVQKVPTLLSFACYNNENAVDLLQKAA